MSDRRHGFTLLEVMLAMTALALVAAICYGAFHLGVRAVQRGEVAVVTAERLRVASDVLIRQIKSTVAYPARNRDEDIYPYFVGTATSMTFVTAAGLQGGGGLTRVVYRLEEAPPRLLLEESQAFSPDTLGREPVDKPGDRATVLLDGFRSLSFQYMLNDGGDTSWQSSWDGQNEEMLPAAVRILVKGMPGLEVDTWGQEIPIMCTTVGDNTGEVDDEQVAESPEDLSGNDGSDAGDTEGDN
ncbi:MAG TPA: type II secretion system protein GspJ [Polyangia bacterium]|nr:type II secretion system protein GspJ [Polyangia bacterium]